MAFDGAPAPNAESVLVTGSPWRFGREQVTQIGMAAA
jgi:hypothetical protein